MNLCFGALQFLDLVRDILIAFAMSTDPKVPIFKFVSFSVDDTILHSFCCANELRLIFIVITDNC
jgi:hypothetical protein